MSILATITGIVLIVIVLADAFETVVFPLRVTRRIRLVRLIYRAAWRIFAALVRGLAGKKRRERYLSYFSPLSLPILLGFWAAVLIMGFALLYWAKGDAIKTPEDTQTFASCLYFSGTTFFTLGLGDITPTNALIRALVVLEAGMGFGFLAIVISYIPALNQSFSKREVNIILLDARAGSPPAAAEILRRHIEDRAMVSFMQFLHEWELWSAGLLESHLSFPVLVYFRSQHENQSWLAALTSILDTCAFIIANVEGTSVHQPRMTFAMARHAIADLALVLHSPPREPEIDRLPLSDFAFMRSLLKIEGLRLREEADAYQRIIELRKMYEPHAYSLSLRLLFPMPPWLREKEMTDNWQGSEWGKSVGNPWEEPATSQDKEHF
jgi:ion channel